MNKDRYKIVNVLLNRSYSCELAIKLQEEWDGSWDDVQKFAIHAANDLDLKMQITDEWVANTDEDEDFERPVYDARHLVFQGEMNTFYTDLFLDFEGKLEKLCEEVMQKLPEKDTQKLRESIERTKKLHSMPTPLEVAFDLKNTLMELRASALKKAIKEQ
jgi:hypothetical protein